jgi:hypothetical protein
MRRVGARRHRRMGVLWFPFPRLLCGLHAVPPPPLSSNAYRPDRGCRVSQSVQTGTGASFFPSGRGTSRVPGGGGSRQSAQKGCGVGMSGTVARGCDSAIAHPGVVSVDAGAHYDVSLGLTQ